MEKIRIFTSFNIAYAPRACLLAESLKRNEQNIEVIALLVDETSTPEAKKAVDVMKRYFDRVVLAKDIGIPNFRQWIFKHNVVEACTAVKPRMLENLFSESPGTVIYMDPDTYSFAPYIRNLLADHTGSILLTPHQLRANQTEASVRDNELGSTKYGIFNLGFACVRATGQGPEFATWWRRSCEMACYEEVAEGIFTDQKWCDHVPGLFSDFQVIRDPGMNVASWNLSQRKIYFDAGGVPCIEGSPLKFFHFTKVGSVGNTMIARYAESNVEAFELLGYYSNQLVQMQKKFPQVKWAYGFFEDGSEIGNEQRVLYRRRNDLMSEFLEPFRIDQHSNYQEWYKSHMTLMGSVNR